MSGWLPSLENDVCKDVLGIRDYVAMRDGAVAAAEAPADAHNIAAVNLMCEDLAARVEADLSLACICHWCQSFVSQHI